MSFVSLALAPVLVGLTLTPGVDPPAPEDARTFTFVDDGVVRVVERGPARGRDDARVPGVFRDPSTGRSAPVLVGSSVVARLATGASPASLAALDVKVTRALMPHLGMWLVQSAIGEDALELAERLAAHRDVVITAYPDLSFRHRAASIDVPPDDPRYSGQFYLDEIDIEDAWALSTGSADVTVVVADNGCDLTHGDLVDKMDPGFDPFENDDDPSWKPGEGNNHGTSCAGLIAATTNNGLDMAGTCPDCRLRCARLLPADGETVTVSSDVLTFEFALDVDADIVSNSWGFVDAIPVPGPLKDAIIDVQQNGRGGLGAVVVFASGNDFRLIGDDELLAVPGVLGVGAVSNLGELTQFSNFGPSVDVVAPTGTLSLDITGAEGADPGDVTNTFGGTSSACPIVAGVAGLILGHDPTLTADDVNAAIMGTAKQSALAKAVDAEGHDDEYGFGLVQPAKAIAFFDEAAPGGDDAPPPGGCGCAMNDESASAADAVLALLAPCFVVVRRRARRSSSA
jgi:subtilisin family serine protease